MTEPTNPIGPAPFGQDTGPWPRGLSLGAGARRVGGHMWVEMRLFELLGGWSTSVGEPAVAVALAAHSRHHAWRAEQWHRQLPDIPGLGPDELVVPPSRGTAAIVDELNRIDEATRTVERLAGAYRVLVPRLIAAYTDHLERTSPVADRPVARTLRIVRDDLVHDWSEGESLLQTLLAHRTAVDAAAARTARLEALLADDTDEPSRPDAATEMATAPTRGA